MPISFPFRFYEGLLRRVDDAGAVLKLMEVMARTAYGSWEASPAFGLRDRMTGPEAKRQPPQAFVQKINDSLIALGIDHFRVISVVREPGRESGTDEYQL